MHVNLIAVIPTACGMFGDGEGGERTDGGGWARILAYHIPRGEQANARQARPPTRFPPFVIIGNAIYRRRVIAVGVKQMSVINFGEA